MPKNMQDVKTLAYVLRRTNYAEADRILNLITPVGKMSAIAKGVRKEKSKLAGGVEMFSLVELNLHQGKSEFGVVTSARMLKYYSKLITDLSRMELAASILKKISVAAEGSDSPDYFRLVDQSLAGLNDEMNETLVESWFVLNLKKVMGEEINVYRDVDGERLAAECRYDWNGLEAGFAKRSGGEFGADEIKMLRLMLSTDLMVTGRVKDYERMLPKIMMLVKTIDR